MSFVFNTSTLPSTRIPGTMSNNMSPQMLPDAKTSNTQMKQATIRDSRNSVSTNSKPASNYSPSSSRNTGRRTGGRGNVNRDNRYNSVKPDFRNNSSTKLSTISNSLDTGRFGYTTNDSSPISIKSTKVEMFTNPLLPGEFDPNNLDLSLMKLAVNVVSIDPLGWSTAGTDSIAKDNFKLIYSKMVSTLANNPSKAYQTAFQDITKVRTYFYNLWTLLIRYYELESILAWKPPHDQYNITLETIRRSFDNQVILFLKIDIAEILRLYYLPTEFVNLANFFNQSFKVGNTSDSKIFKFMTKELANAIGTNSTTTYIDTVRAEIARVNGTVDNTPANILSNYTVAQISGFLEKDFTFGKVYSTGMPSAANRSIHDLDAYDIFINQYTLYSNGNTKLIFPSFLGTQNTPYVTHKEGSQLNSFTIASQGYSSGPTLNANQTGIVVEDTVTVQNFFGENRTINKVAFSVLPNGNIGMTGRLSTKNHMINDFHFVNMSIPFPFEKVSIPPSHTQLVYSNGQPIKDVATRSFQNQIFGNL